MVKKSSQATVPLTVCGFMLLNLLTYLIKYTENRLLLILKVIGIFYVNPSTEAPRVYELRN
jgi:hypothetical protein